MQEQKKKLSSKLKKAAASILITALVVGMIPASSATVLGDTINHLCTMILEPTMVYRDVYGFVDGVSTVTSNDNKTGLINTSGKELISCKYRSIVQISGTKQLLVWEQDYTWKIVDYNDKLICDLGTDTGSMRSIGSDILTFVGMTYKSDYERERTGKDSVFLRTGTNTFKKINGYVGIQKTGVSNRYLAYSLITETSEYSYYIVDGSGNVVKNLNSSEASVVRTNVIKTLKFDWENNTKECELYDANGKVIVAKGTYEDVKDVNDSRNYYVTYINKTKALTDNSLKAIVKFSSDEYVYNLGTDIYTVTNSSTNTCKIIKTNGSVLFAAGKYTEIYKLDDIYYIGNKADGSSEMFMLNGTVKYKSKTDTYITGYTDKYVIVGYSDPNKGDTLYNYNNTVALQCNSGEYLSTYCNGAIRKVKYSAGTVPTIYSITTVDGKQVPYSGKITEVSGEENGYFAFKVNGKWGIMRLYDETVRPVTATVKAPAKVSKVTVKVGKKKITVKIKKVKKAKGYQIQYSTNKKFKNVKKKFTNKTTITIKKLKSKKKYYVRVRAYKLNGKKKVFSKKWSTVKRVIVK